MNTLARQNTGSTLDVDEETLQRHLLLARQECGVELSGDKALEEIVREIVLLRGSKIITTILGEPGVGKEGLALLIAKANGSTFIPVNVAALSATLIESELFGHTKGAFTDARGERKGRFDQIIEPDTTLFLDEIGELPPFIQAKLLRAFEAREFSRVGTNDPIHFKGNIICATNVDLAEVNSQIMRDDFLARITQNVYTLPPLVDRSETHKRMVIDAVVGKIAKKMKCPLLEITDEAREILATTHFPENIRGLHGVIEKTASYLMNSHPQGKIELVHIERALLKMFTVQTEFENGRDSEEKAVDFDLLIEKARTGGIAKAIFEVKRELICRTIDLCKGNVAEASRVLGINRNTIKAYTR